MTRKLKVYSQSMSGTYTEVPTILLKGQWLRNAGFEAGEYVEVQCEGDKIILTKTQKSEQDKISIEDKVKKLDKKQREKLSEIIDKL